MTDKETSAARCAVLVGSYTSGKTTLMEAMLHTAGAITARARSPRATRSATLRRRRASAR